MKIVFDIGATNTRVAGSTDGRTLSEPIIFNTQPDFGSGINELISAIRQVTADQTITGLAGGIAGTLDHDYARLERSNNLPQWIDKPIQQLLQDAFNVRVKLENDTTLVGLGEAVHGAGKPYSSIVYYTVSTGVNASRVVGGVIDSRTFSSVGGQIIANGQDGAAVRLEQAVGGRALQERYHKTSKELAQDPAIWPEVIHHLAIGIYNTLHHWPADAVVIGGGMAHDIPLDQLSQEVASLYITPRKIPEFRMAELGDRGGLYGALAFDAAPNP